MQPIRNIAIIAHVDHGKTTLVDKIIDQAKILDDRKERKDLLLDNNDLERERGITILSKNVSVNYTEFKGWSADLTKMTSAEELPQTLMDYVAFIEKGLGLFIDP